LVESGVPAKWACSSLGVNRATLYRRRAPPRTEENPEDGRTRARPERALSDEETQEVLDLLRSERFVDQAPAAVYAALLDDGRYLCSIRTMYRILDAHGEVKERRNQLRHPAYAEPQLEATGPNQVWSWDITKLKGPVKWTYFHLFVILDIFSRRAVGWMVAGQESTSLAKRLIEETCDKEDVRADELTLHADRGSSMKSKGVAQLLADLGVTKSHSRPRVSNDNPFSEAQFKTLKYRPTFPGSFESLEDARSFLVPFFDWYNNDHYHSGLDLLAVYHWWSDWSRTARAGITKRRWLISLGLAKQRRAPESANTDSVSDEEVTDPVTEETG
jgi:putative transposase